MAADEVPRRLVGDSAGLDTYEAVARSAGFDDFHWVDTMLEPTERARARPVKPCAIIGRGLSGILPVIPDCFKIQGRPAAPPPAT